MRRALADGPHVLIVRPDFARRIDLPGAGPCPRPIDIDRSRTGFADLVALRVYSFAAGIAIDGEAEADEVFIVVMNGAADFTITRGGAPAGSFALRIGGMRVLYMPPHASYRLSAIADCDIAYARVQPTDDECPRADAFALIDGQRDLAGYATGMDLRIVSVESGDTVGSDGDGERFVHVRSNDEGTVSLNGKALRDWDAVALERGERLLLEGRTGSAEMLIVTASERRHETSCGDRTEP